MVFSFLSLGDNALSGNIPTELGVLEGLATLDIGENERTISLISFS